MQPGRELNTYVALRPEDEDAREVLQLCQEGAAKGRTVELVSKLAQVFGRQGLTQQAARLAVSVLEARDRYRAEIARGDKVFDMQPPPEGQFPHVVNRLEVMSGLDLKIERLPQQGQLSLKANGENYTVRVSTLPVEHGEHVWVRF